jgi:hypothetical protein
LNSHIKQAEASVDSQFHYYLVLKWTLHIEIVDQIKMALYINPAKDTYEKFSSRKMLDRAYEMSVACSAKILSKALDMLQLEAHPARPHVTSTVSNIFDPTIVKVMDDKNNTQNGIVYYENCTPTHRVRNGLIAERGGGTPAWLFFHGPTGDCGFGGESWKQPKSSSAFPTIAGDIGWNQAMLKTMGGEGGWSSKHGYFKLQHVVTL